MKFFLDENFPRSAITQLKGAGHEAAHAMDVFPPGSIDEKLFAHAQAECAIFVTTDRDFFHTVPLSFPQHRGAIVITLRRANRIDLLRRLSDALTLQAGKSLDDTVLLVTDTRIYRRQKT